MIPLIIYLASVILSWLIYRGVLANISFAKRVIEDRAIPMGFLAASIFIPIGNLILSISMLIAYLGTEYNFPYKKFFMIRKK